MAQGAGIGPFTHGFRNSRLLQKHWYDHGREVNATDALHYQALADRFLGDPTLPNTTRECVRPRAKAIVRWNYVTQEFGALSADGFILTYFIANPRFHGFPTNRAYFQYECGR